MLLQLQSILTTDVTELQKRQFLLNVSFSLLVVANYYIDENDKLCNVYLSCYTQECCSKARQLALSVFDRL